MKGKLKVDIFSGSLDRNLLVFALPLAFTGILQQLFNAADVAVVGRLVSSDAMAAVGSNSSIIGLIINLFTGIALGSNVVIARLLGQGNKKKITTVIDVSLIFGITLGAVFAILCQFAADPVLKLMGVPEEVFDMASAYLKIYLAGLPVIFVYNLETAVFRAQGDSVTPLIALVIAGVVNVFLNIFFVLAFNMSADGVATATVISNLISSVILFVILKKTDKIVGLPKHKIRFDLSVLGMILRIGLPAGIQGSMFSVSNIIIQSAINSLGADIMAASSAAFNIEIFVYYILNALGQACTTFVSGNFGAGNIKRCREVVKKSLGINIILSIICTSFVLIFSKQLLLAFNDDPIIISYGSERLKWVVGGEILNAFMEIFSGAMRGYGYSTVPAVITVFGVCVVRIAWVYTVFQEKQAFSTLLQCYPISWAVTSLLLVISYFYYINKKIIPVYGEKNQ